MIKNSGSNSKDIFILDMPINTETEINAINIIREFDMRSHILIIVNIINTFT